ncbi:hypothetical protein HYH02_010414 [Chlamydomonas schloesseri]|uniref:SET domain-containing protein n=1 Tax=Chlamydomonas schloesseri TaxID=2026947 RepID=A0A835TAL5_9CHLO|nr:hypothetical protein HYH02_010414 [Chlamydomonas schloesseri]|eukprot:KAG2440536.1 hypothetical protein HYH02_010414 [Chlamydomonas schloesseri]
MLWLAQQVLPRLATAGPGAGGGLLQPTAGDPGGGAGLAASALDGGSGGGMQLPEAALLSPAAMTTAGGPAVASPSSVGAAATEGAAEMVWMGDLPLPLEMLAWCRGVNTPAAAAAPAPLASPSIDAAAAATAATAAATTAAAATAATTAAAPCWAAAAVLGANPCWARYACDDASYRGLAATFLCASLPPGAADPDAVDAGAYSYTDGWSGGTAWDGSPPPAPPSTGSADAEAGGVLGTLWRQTWQGKTQEGVLSSSAPPPPTPPAPVTPAPGISAPNATAYNASATSSPPSVAPAADGCPGPNGNLSGCASIWRLGDPFVGLAQVMKDNGITAPPPPPGQQTPAPPRASWLASTKGGYAVLAVTTFCGALVVVAVALAAYMYLFPPAKPPSPQQQQPAAADAADAGAGAGVAAGNGVGAPGTGAAGAAAAAPLQTPPAAAPPGCSPANSPAAPAPRGPGGGARMWTSSSAYHPSAVVPDPDTPTRCENGEAGGHSAEVPVGGRAGGLKTNRCTTITTTDSRRTVSSCGTGEASTARSSPASAPRNAASSSGGGDGGGRNRVLSVSIPLRPLVVPAEVATVHTSGGWCDDGGGDGDVVPGLPLSVSDAARSSYSWRRRGGGSWRERGSGSGSSSAASSSPPSRGAVGCPAGAAAAGGTGRVMRAYGVSDDGRSRRPATAATAATGDGGCSPASVTVVEAVAMPPNTIASPGGGAAPSLPAVASAAMEVLSPATAASAAAASGMTQTLTLGGGGGAGISPRSWRSLRASAPSSGSQVAPAGTATAVAESTQFSLYADLLAESIELRRRRRSCVTVELRAETPRGGDKDAAAEAGPGAEDLGNFLGWLVANGVQGIGQEDSKVALFEAEGGERGLVCEEPIAAGEVVLEVPLRLALTDHPGDEESNALLYEGAPWSVRLACKLLRHKAAGAASPWSAYVKVLPAQVPAPLETFGWEDIQGLRYPAAEEALHAADWLRADAAEAAGEQATGGLGVEDFNWALSVVHSRTFANAAPGGGVGVRMLVPLIDMMNHAGDEAELLSPSAVAGGGGGGAEGGDLEGLGLGGPVVARDNVRWDLLPPGRSGSGGWAMAVSATRPLAPGQELMLSYGERSNDDFFLHYGFVPRANPHDDAVLWPDLEAALEWHYSRFGAQRLSEAEAEPLYSSALAAGLAEQEAEVRQRLTVAGSSSSVKDQQPEQQQMQPPPLQAAAQGAGDPLEALPEEVLRQLKQIKVLSRGRVTEAVMRAFAAVSGEAAAAAAAAAAERAVACRCAELLRAMARPALPQQPGADDVGEDLHADAPRGAALPAGGLLVDLALLLADAEPRLRLLMQPSSSGSPSTAAGEGAGTAAAAVEAALEGDAAYWAAQLRGYCRALLPQYAALLPVDAAAVASAATAAAATAAIDSAPGASSATAPAPASAGGLKSKYKMPPPSSAGAAAPAGAGGISSPSPSPGPSNSSSNSPSTGASNAIGSGSLPLARLLQALLLAAAAAGPAGGGAGGLTPGQPAVLTGPQRLSTTFRAYKQMVLWDAVVGGWPRETETGPGSQRNCHDGVNAAVASAPDCDLTLPSRSGEGHCRRVPNAEVELHSKQKSQQPAADGAVASVVSARQVLVSSSTSRGAEGSSAAAQSLTGAASILSAAVVTAGTWKRSKLLDPAESCTAGAILLDGDSTEPSAASHLAAGRCPVASQRASSTSGHLSARLGRGLSSEAAGATKCGHGGAAAKHTSHSPCQGQGQAIGGLMRMAASLPPATVVDMAQVPVGASGHSGAGAGAGAGAGDAGYGFAGTPAGAHVQAAADTSLAGLAGSGVSSGPAATPGAAGGLGRAALPLDLRSSPLPHRSGGRGRAFAALAAGVGAVRAVDSGQAASSEHPCSATQHPPSAGGGASATTATHTAMGFGSSLQSACSSLGLNHASADTNAGASASMSDCAHARQLSRHLSGMEAAAAAASAAAGGGGGPGGGRPARAGSTVGNTTTTTASFMMDLDLSSSIAPIRTSAPTCGSAGAAAVASAGGTGGMGGGSSRGGYPPTASAQSPIAALMAHNLGSSGGTGGTASGLATAAGTAMCSLSFTPTATGTGTCATTTLNANMLTDASASSGGRPHANATATWLASPNLPQPPPPPPQQQQQQQAARTNQALPSPPAAPQELLGLVPPQLRDSSKSPPRPSMDMGFIRATTLSELSQQLEGLRWLASGSSGRVYTGLWKGSPVAVKIVVSHTPDQMRDNAREALLSRVVSHPCVTQCYTVCFDVVTGEHLRLPQEQPSYGARRSPEVSCTFHPADAPSSHSTVLLSSGRPGSVGAIRAPGAGPLHSSASLRVTPRSLNTSGGGGCCVNSIGMGAAGLPNVSPGNSRGKRNAQGRTLGHAMAAMAAAAGARGPAAGFPPAAAAAAAAGAGAAGASDDDDPYSRPSRGTAGSTPPTGLASSPRGRGCDRDPAAVHQAACASPAEDQVAEAAADSDSPSALLRAGSSMGALLAESGGSSTPPPHALDVAGLRQLAPAAAAREQEKTGGSGAGSPAEEQQAYHVLLSGLPPTEAGAHVNPGEVGVADTADGGSASEASSSPPPPPALQLPLYRSRLHGQVAAAGIAVAEAIGGVTGSGARSRGGVGASAGHLVSPRSGLSGSQHAQAYPISNGSPQAGIGYAADALLGAAHAAAASPPQAGAAHAPTDLSGGANAALSSDSQYASSFTGLHAALGAAGYGCGYGGGGGGGGGANVLSLNSSGMNRDLRRGSAAAGACLGASGTANSSYGAGGGGGGASMLGYGGEINTTLSLSELLRTCGGAGEEDSTGGLGATSLPGVLVSMGTVPGRYVTVVVLEWCNQGTLLQAIRHRPFNPERSPANGEGLLALLRTALEVAQGMRYLHSLGIIHGDLKPSNVLLQSHVSMPDSAGRWVTDSRGYVAKVADFGLAVPAAASGSTGAALGISSAKGGGGSSGSTCAWGALAYLAPEVPERGPSKKSDVWSYGCVLYHMCTGRQPFQGIRQGRLLLGLATGELKLEWPDHVYKLLRRLGEACCARDARERPSFDRVVTALQKIIKHVSSPASAGGGAGGSAAGMAAQGARAGSTTDMSSQLGGTASRRTTGDGTFVTFASTSTRANSNATALAFASALMQGAPLPTSTPSDAPLPVVTPHAPSYAAAAPAAAVGAVAGELGSPAAAGSMESARRAGAQASKPQSGSSGLALRELDPEAAKAAQEWRAALAGCAQLGGAGLFVAGAPAAPADYSR